MALDAALRETLTDVARVMREAREPWWVIASAAAALHGAEPIAVADVDVLLGVADAERLLPGLGLPVVPGSGSERFRSEVFAVWRGGALPVEFMAGLRCKRPDGWHAILPATRRRIALGEATLYTPDRGELIELFEDFSRPKDLERARLLRLSQG